MANTKVYGEQIVDGSITAAKLADGTIVAAELADNAVETDAINADAVTGAKIADNAIDSEHYVDGSIDTAHIAASQITVAKMAANSIDSDQYVDGSIDTAHIAASQVTTAKIADGNISTAKLADLSVTSGKLATNLDLAGTLDVTGLLTADAGITTAANQRVQSSSGMLFLTGASAIPFEVGAGSEKMRLTATGLGIGTTSPANNLHIHCDSGDEGILIKSTGDTSNAIVSDANRGSAGAAILATQGKWNGTNVADILLLTGADTSNKDDGVITFRTSSADNIAERMRIDASGFVGINTAGAASYTPLTLETASGSAYAAGGVNGVGLLLRNRSSTVGTSSGIKWAANSSYHDLGGIHMVLTGNSNTNETADLTFFTSNSGDSGNTEKMRVTSGGSVGIGTTAPATDLQIGDYSDNAETLTFATASDQTGRINFYNANASEGASMRVTGGGAGAKMHFANRYNTDADKVTFDLVNGRVGIGATSPESILNVKTTKTVALSSAAHFLTLGLTIDDSTAYDTAGGGGGIAFRTPRNSSGTQTVFAAIDGAKEGTSNDGYTGALRFYTNQNSTGVPLERMRIDSSGRITAPYQPAFLAQPSGTQSDIAINANVDIALATEIFDQGANFASSTFTAPVTGKYQLQANVRLQNLDAAAVYYHLNLVTSNKTYYNIFDPDFGQDAPYWTLVVTVLADMDASDTAKLQIFQSGGTSQTDIHSGFTTFSGYLVA